MLPRLVERRRSVVPQRRAVGRVLRSVEDDGAAEQATRLERVAVGARHARARVRAARRASRVATAATDRSVFGQTAVRYYLYWVYFKFSYYIKSIRCVVKF